MTNTSSKRIAHRGRIFPEYTIPPEELARRQAEREEFYRRCRIIFDRVCPDLIDKHYDWFIIIEPDSGDYFIDVSKEEANQKARHQHPDAWLGVFRINETGACGRI